MRKKQGAERFSDEPVAKPDKDIEIIDVCGYQLLPLHLPATGTIGLEITLLTGKDQSQIKNRKKD